MKGKKIEAATSGVVYDKPLACNANANVMAAARMKRKRGGAVAHGMPGSAPKKRMDKPSRGRDVSAPAPKPVEEGFAKGGKTKERAKGGDVGSLDKIAEKTAGKMLASSENKPGRKRGGAVAGKVGADVKPMTTSHRHAAPTRQHSTQPNIT